MPTYVTLINFTDQGVRTIRDLPQRQENARRAIEAAGGQAVQLLLAIGSLGNIRTTTLRAFTEEETRNIVQAMPSA